MRRTTSQWSLSPAAHRPHRSSLSLVPRSNRGSVPLADTPADDRRQCPTRASGAQPLIAHHITFATCLERQRRNYHKCFTCSYRGLGANAPAALAAPPLGAPRARVEAEPEPPKKPARRKATATS